MAEAIIFNVAGEIITKLGSPLLKESKLWWGLKDELEKLRMTISTIQAVLLDAEEKYSQSHQVKNWVNLLKEAFYDADDLLDEFSTKALKDQMRSDISSRMVKKVSMFLSSSNRFAYAFKMAHNIKRIRSKLDGIAANKNFHLDERGEEKFVVATGRESHSSLPEVIIGREDDKMRIIEFLLSSDYMENVSILSIVGMGGLGKTTLAQLVWNDETVKSQFELKLWASVSDNFDVKLILEKILESVMGEKPRNLEMNTLKNVLHENINRKRYLLVLDDVWNENSETWFQLRDLLVGGARGSRIIVTTRLKNVAEMIRSDSVYELQGLADSESWSLFVKMAFKQGQVPSLMQKTVGKEIVAKCVGVPLAIRAIGRLLYSKNISEWFYIKDKELSNMKEVENSILPILKLSYDHMPSHLKHCFAYCRLFPKGYRISVPHLVNVWMAQGYIISSDSEECLEDVGYEYFKNLLWRSFFQDVEEDDFGVIHCKIHALIYDLAVLVAGEESSQLNSNEALACGIKKGTRHVRINFEVDSYLKVSNIIRSARNVRSFVSCSRQETKRGELHVILSSLKRVRALDLSDMGIDRIPNCIYKLIHIRYLNLSNNKHIEMLPDSITRLQNLQMLHLFGCERLKQLPKDIKKFINLRRLNILGCVSLTHMPRGLGQLTSLKHLRAFVLGRDNGVSKHIGGLGELHELNHLRQDLHIMNLCYVKNPSFEFEAANLKAKKHLQILRLAWNLGEPYDDNIDESSRPDDEILSIDELRPHLNLKWLVVNGCGRLKFPSWVSSLTNLVRLQIENCRMCQHFPPLDQFPYLKQMVIDRLLDLEYIEIGMLSENQIASFFPSLKNLWLSNCPNLKGWWTDAFTPVVVQFSCLDQLQIESCPNLTSMPLIPSVQNLILKNGSMEDILAMNILVPQHTSCFPVSPVLSQLKTLGIHKIEDLDYLPEDMMQNLTSLQQLEIRDCPKLKTFSNVMQHLTSLEVLTIEACEELDWWDDDSESGSQWQFCGSFRELHIRNILKLISMPNVLLHISTLSKLIIIDCPELVHLPEWMSRLIALELLEIDNCPQLSERCNNNMAADWPKISHVPYVKIEGKWIQSDGSYKL